MKRGLNRIWEKFVSSLLHTQVLKLADHYITLLKIPHLVHQAYRPVVMFSGADPELHLKVCHELMECPVGEVWL